MGHPQLPVISTGVICRNCSRSASLILPDSRATVVEVHLHMFGHTKWPSKQDATDPQMLPFLIVNPSHFAGKRWRLRKEKCSAKRLYALFAWKRTSYSKKPHRRMHRQTLKLLECQGALFCLPIPHVPLPFLESAARWTGKLDRPLMQLAIGRSLR